MNYLKSLWAKEPVRAALYSVLGVLAGLLVAKGAVSGDVVDLVLAAVATVVGVPAVEVARSQVTPAA